MKPGGRFPVLASLEALRDSAWSTAKRFPVVLALCFACAAYAVWLVGLYEEQAEFHHVLFSLAIGLPLSLGLALVTERYAGFLRRHSITLNLALVLGLVLHYLLMEQTRGEGYDIRYAHQIVIVGVAFFVASFLGRDEGNGFRQFTRSFLTRALVSSLYSAVFFASFSLAIQSVKYLFDVKVEDLTYLRLWLLTVFVFFPWHLMAGLPGRLAALNRDRAWPGYLRVFAQYLLVPIVAAYALILYAYMARIVWLRNWPRGTVAWLVTGISIVGTFTWLIAGAFRDDGKARLLGAFHRTFFWLLPPLLLLHLLGLWRRVSEYGLTEPRYFLFGLGLWMLAMAGYYLFGRKKDIRLIPVSLALISVASLWGPWSAYDVAVRDQAGRLSALFARNGLIEKGKLAPARKKVDWEERREMSSKLDYLVSRGRLGALESLLTPGLKRIADDADSGDIRYRRGLRDRSGKFMAELGMKYVEEWEKREERGKRSHDAWFHCYPDGLGQENPPLPVSGMDYAKALGEKFKGSFTAGGRKCGTRLNPAGTHLELLVDGSVAAHVSLEQVARTVRGGRMTVSHENERVRLLLLVTELSGYASKDTVRIDTGTGILFIKLK